MSTETGILVKNYCESLTSYVRRKSCVVHIGDVPLGGSYPIRVQSMTTTDTLDTIGTVEQSIRMIEAGCEYVRITAPSIKEAENLQNIKNELRKRGYKTPLVADIHFTPNAAEAAARIVEKVRVNPGNYADKKKFEHIEYTDATYNSELERIRQRFIPLVKICKEHGTAMRIGANHGSLSDRIMSRYGDTPLGMVESALEFLRICEENDFKEIVLSMKSSNPLVMVEAYRLLIEKMDAENMNYPLHLGVTEAGEGEDGRIKSAAGIGTLLEDGIGDTIRVSLTEDPEFEIPVAKMLVGRYNDRAKHAPIPPVKEPLPYSPTEYKKRETRETGNFGGKNHPRIIGDLSNRKEEITQAGLFTVGHSYNVNTGTWKSFDQAADYIFTGDKTISFTLPEGIHAIDNAAVWKKEKQPNSFPFFKTVEEYIGPAEKSSLNFVSLKIGDISGSYIDQLKNDKNIVFVVETNNEHGMAEERRMFIELLNKKNDAPVIIKRRYETGLDDVVRLYAATDAAPEAQFFTRVLLQPYAEYLASRGTPDLQSTASVCPFCGAKPVVGVLRGEGEGARRSLVCALCATEWPFRRVVCPHCSEENKDKLPVYIAEQTPYLRLDACDSCGSYFKSVDLTRNGHAVPIVDELASVSLSIWADEHGYVKAEPNLLGM